MCSTEPLPLAKERPDCPIEQLNPIVFVNPVDSTGQAIVRKRSDLSAKRSQMLNLSISEDESVYQLDQQIKHATVSFVSRTTAWRKRKAAAAQQTSRLHRLSFQFSIEN